LGAFLHNDENERLLVYLFNQCLNRHFESRGLIVDKKRKRAYFPRSKQGASEVTYQARLRRATRTVAKPFVSRVSQQVRYWEHKSLRFRFERFGNSWVLQILPGYVFTVDGYKRLLEGERVGVLATRRASHDYNMQVHNDLYFWTWVLADGNDVFLLDAGGTHFSLRGTLAEYEVRDILPSLDAVADLDEPAADELAEIEEELAMIAELSAKAVRGKHKTIRKKGTGSGRVSEAKPKPKRGQ
jgi:hypothetical protein